MKRTMSGRIADGVSLASDLERARRDFHKLLTAVGDDEWTKPTSGTRWTNEQLLFHMVFGYMVVQRLLILVLVLGHLPDWIGRWFARMLNAASRPFHVINFYGTNVAAVVYNRNRMGAKMDRTINALQRSLIRQGGAALSRGIHFPTRWDPYFQDSMTLVDVYRYPGQHDDHHRRQLSLAALN
jgi:DinB superfamily